MTTTHDKARAEILATARGAPNDAEAAPAKYVEPAGIRYRRASLASLEIGDVMIAQVYASLATAVATDELTRSIGGEW